jgi:hypothetical protein
MHRKNKNTLLKVNKYQYMPTSEGQILICPKITVHQWQSFTYGIYKIKGSFVWDPVLLKRLLQSLSMIYFICSVCYGNGD